jgi:hypothetical protein
MVSCECRVRRRRRTAVPDAGACQNFGCVRLVVVESRRTGDHGDRVVCRSGECRSKTPAWRGFDTGGGSGAILAKPGNADRGRRLADRRGVSRVGLGQQPDAEAFVGRPGGHRADQRGCGRSHESASGAASRRAPSAHWRDRSGACCRVPRRRSQSGLVRAGAPRSRQRPDGGLFLARAVPRRGHRDLPARRAGDASTGYGRRAHGVRPMASSERAARTPASARGARARTPARPR